VLVENLIPPPPFGQRVENLRQACRAYNAMGFGAVRDPIVTRDEFGIYQALWAQGGLSVRCRTMFLVAPQGSVAERLAEITSFGVRAGFGDDWLKIWGLKSLMDGGPEAAALEQPYADRPTYAGNLYWDTDELVTVASFAVQQGWRLGIHAAGDRAVRAILDAYERVLRDNPGIAPGSLVIEHALLADATQRARAIALGIPITVQHPLLYELGAEFLTHWGAERTSRIGPIGAWLAEGAQLSAGCDYPAGPDDPMLNLWGMVTRGTNHVGVQGSAYAIDQYAAVRLATAAGAELNGEGHRRGTLRPGRLADLVAFRANPITCPVDDLPALRPAFTIVGGRVTHDPDGLLAARA
jgi:predicted amidohydrolase YtcJ